MEYLFNIGFLGTSAPYYIDCIVLYLLTLPFLMSFSILFATNKKYSLHHFTQTLLFILTLATLVAFNYGIYMIDSSIEDKFIFFILVFELSLSLFLVISWLTVLLFAGEDRRRRGLPGLYSKSHRKSGKRVFLIMIFTIITLLYLYWILYVRS